MMYLPIRYLVLSAGLARLVYSQGMTINAVSTFGACGRACIKSALNAGYTRHTCSAVATPAGCVCQQAASTFVNNEIVGCVNFRCEPSSTTVATQIFESHCGGDSFPTALIPDITPLSSSLLITQDSASPTQSVFPNLKLCMNDLLKSLTYSSKPKYDCET